MYEIVIDEQAIEFLEKMEKPISKRIFKKIQTAKEDPLRFFERLEGRKDYKLRVGDYRIIADINREKKRIEVTQIGHRKNIYA